MANILKGLQHSLRLASDAHLARLTTNPASMALYGSLADPHMALQRLATSSPVEGQLRFGTIVDCVPYMQFYRVLPDSGGVFASCTTLRHGAAGPIGVADGTTYPPGSRVQYIEHPSGQLGWIIGAVPPFQYDPRECRSYPMGLGTCCGILADLAWGHPLNLGGSGTHGGVSDHAAGTPLDSLPTGEFVYTSETGLLISLDAYMAQMRVDPMTGLFLFYLDHLCRLAGHNLEIWSAGSVQESLDDEGEHLWYHGIATYLWEQVGKLTGPGGLLIPKTREERESQPWLGRLEPAEIDAQPFHRVQHYGGYLGQGGKTIVCAPPEGIEWLRHGEPTNLPGLAEQAITLRGTILQRSATGLILAKQPLIPVPKRMRAPTDKAGDTAENYRPAGYEELGDGPPHIVGEPPVAENGEEDSEVITKAEGAKVAGIDDVQAHAFNWEANYPFHYHERDYHLPEESECDWVQPHDPPQYNTLKQKHALPQPKYDEVYIDRVHGKIKVFYRSCSVSFLDEGGVVLSAGDGSEIRLNGDGNVSIQVPGDISLEAGRNINLQAGRDVTVRAKQSVDVSATDNDVRMCANNNVEILGGAGNGPHGVLIESRGVGPQYDPNQGHAAQHSGVNIVSPRSPVAIAGGDVYVRTGIPGGRGGMITLDAAKGDADIVTHCNTFVRFGNLYVDNFGRKGEVSSSNNWSEQGAYIVGAAHISGGLWVNGPMASNGGCYTIGVMASSQMAPFVAKLGDNDIAKLAAAFTKIDEQMFTDIPENMMQYYNNVFTEYWYAASRPGNDGVLSRLQFSFRTTEDYGTQDWYMYEPRWAQMARRNEQEPEVWEEKPVKFGGADTYPYPGMEALLGRTYFQVDSGLVDPATGRAADRGEAYEHISITGIASVEPTNNIYPIIG